MMMEREPGGFRPTVRANFFPRLLLVFAGLSLLSVLYTYSRPVNLQLTMDMASSQAGVAQLFYDTGRAFNEADSSTCRVDASSPASFEHLSFSLPEKTILRLRFDPLTSAGRVVIRNVQIRNKKAVLENIPVSRIMPFNQIAERTERRDEVEFVTVPGANDPGVILGLAKPLRLRWVFAGQNLLRLGVINACLAALCVLIALTKPQLTPGWRRLLLFARRVNRLFERAANRFPRGSFLAMDATAFWIYAGLIVFFCLACLLDLNGSSSALYGTVYGNGPAAKPWIGTPKDVRVDEWAYVTPDILNQYYRADRFEAKRSVLGDHFVALTGNVPVRDVSTFFRPQFWAFFALPLDYAYSVYWQAKALLLVAGVFTFLLWLTRSTRWALAGALWYFFSPFIQWSYSWPSALPEMIGSLCLGTTCFCYLTVGRKSGWLALAAVAMVALGGSGDSDGLVWGFGSGDSPPRRPLAESGGGALIGRGVVGSGAQRVWRVEAGHHRGCGYALSGPACGAWRNSRDLEVRIAFPAMGRDREAVSSGAWEHLRGIGLSMAGASHAVVHSAALANAFSEGGVGGALVLLFHDFLLVRFPYAGGLRANHRA
jgi:hypothetical protein